MHVNEVSIDAFPAALFGGGAVSKLGIESAELDSLKVHNRRH